MSGLDIFAWIVLVILVGRGIPKGGKRTDFHFTRKRFMVPRGFAISKVG
jgi:hypothetical protein